MPSISKFKKILFSMIAGFVVIMIILAVTEIAFRIAKGPPEPLLSITQSHSDYLFEPNSVINTENAEFKYSAHINKYGYRGVDFQHPKEKGKVRIFAVGDSFTFGVGSQDDQTIPYLIEKKLKEENIHAEVINAGVGHASPIYHYFNLRNIHLQYEPDIVLLLLDLTDVQDDWHHQRHAVLDDQGEIAYFDETYINGKKSWWRTLIRHSVSWRQFNKKVVRSWKKMRLLGRENYSKFHKEKKRAKAIIASSDEGIFPDEVILEYDAMLMMRGHKRERLIRQQWRRTAANLLKIKNMLDAKNIHFILGMYPYGIYVGPEQWKNGRLTWGFEENKVYTDLLAFELVGSFAKENEIPFINTLDAFLKAGKGQYFFDWDGHLTPAGNEIVAQNIISNKNFQEILRK